MSENRPGPGARKSSFLAPLAIAAVVGAILGAILLSSHLRPAPPKPAPPAPPAAAPPPAPPPALTRGDLLDAADAAAGSYAAGGPAASRRAWVGRAFQLRLPFGCEGPQIDPGAAQASFTYDPDKQTLKLAARPAILTSLPLVEALTTAPKPEAVEGFWIPRPWTRSEACPPHRDQPAPATQTPAANPTLGLAELFTSSSSRVLRRDGRAYEYVARLPDSDTTRLTHTYRLVLEGRLSGFGDEGALRCWSESADHRPVCLYAVTFDRVAFEDAADGKVLAEWRS